MPAECVTHERIARHGGQIEFALRSRLEDPQPSASMADANTIALVSVVVTGTTAIVAPAVSAWGQRRTEHRRRVSDREDRDIAELRALLDEIAAALSDVLWQLSSVGKERDEDRFQELFDHWRHLLRLAGRLAMRLGSDHPAVLDCETAATYSRFVVMFDPHDSPLTHRVLDAETASLEALIVESYEEFDAAREDFYESCALLVGSPVAARKAGPLTVTWSRSGRLARLRR